VVGAESEISTHSLRISLASRWRNCWRGADTSSRRQAWTASSTTQSRSATPTAGCSS